MDSKINFSIPTTHGPRSFLIYREQIFRYLGQSWVIFREGRKYNISHFETGINIGYVTTPTHDAIYGMFQKRIPGTAQRNTPERRKEMEKALSEAVKKEYYFSLAEKNTAPSVFLLLQIQNAILLKEACAKEYKERREAEKEQRAALAQQERAERLSDPDKIPAAAKKWADELIWLPSDPAEYYTDDYLLNQSGYGDALFEGAQVDRDRITLILKDKDYLPEFTAEFIAPTIVQRIEDAEIELEMDTAHQYHKTPREVDRISIGEICEKVCFKDIEPAPDIVTRRKDGLLQVARYLCEKYNDWSNLKPEDYLNAIKEKGVLGFYYYPSRVPALLLPPLVNCLETFKIWDFFFNFDGRAYFVFPLSNGEYLCEDGTTRTFFNEYIARYVQPCNQYREAKQLKRLDTFCKNALSVYYESQPDERGQKLHSPYFAHLSAEIQKLYIWKRDRFSSLETFILF